MNTIPWILTSLLLSQPSAKESVQRSVSTHNEAFRHCFERQQVQHGFGKIRFSVDSTQRAQSVRMAELEPNDPELARCLTQIVTSVAFEADAIGARVLYPITFEGASRVAGGSQNLGTPEQAQRAGVARPGLNIVKRENVFLIDDWEVQNKAGIGISDITLAKISGDEVLHTELVDRQASLFTYSLIEGLLAAGGLALAGYGTSRLLDDPGRDSRGRDIGFAAGGGTVSVTAGLLCLVHLVMALDLGAGKPTWHHLDLVDAERLVARSNG